MSAKRPPGLFITGTDTGIGKTYVAAIIARSLVISGFRVGVYKPVLSGFSVNLSSSTAESLRGCQDDDVLLWLAAGSPGDVAKVAPQRFQAPVAPHLAARAEGREVDAAFMRAGVDYWRERSDFVLVEGAGGLMSPISDEQYNADLARDLQYPLLIVSPNRLGTINQTLQTMITARSFGLPVAAVILNELPLTATSDFSRETNLVELQRRCRIPVFQIGPGDHPFDPPIPWPKLIDSSRVP